MLSIAVAFKDLPTLLFDIHVLIIACLQLIEMVCFPVVIFTPLDQYEAAACPGDSRRRW